MSEHYYEREDVPDMADATTAVSLYREQRQALPAIDLANQTMDDLYTLVGAAYEQAGNAGMAEVQAGLVTMWDRMKDIHQASVHYDAALAGADVALSAMETQRLDALSELEALVQAISSRDYERAEIQSLADDIEDDVRQGLDEEISERIEMEMGEVYAEAYDEAEWQVRDELDEQIIEHLRNLGQALGVQTDRKTALKLLELLRGERSMDEAETEAMTALLAAVAARLLDGAA